MVDIKVDKYDTLVTDGYITLDVQLFFFIHFYWNTLDF